MHEKDLAGPKKGGGGDGLFQSEIPVRGRFGMGVGGGNHRP